MTRATRASAPTQQPDHTHTLTTRDRAAPLHEPTARATTTQTRHLPRPTNGCRNARRGLSRGARSRRAARAQPAGPPRPATVTTKGLCRSTAARVASAVRVWAWQTSASKCGTADARDGGAVRAEAVPATGVPSSLKKRKEERVGAVSAWHHEMPELRSRPWDGDAYIALHRPPSAKNPEETLRNPKLGFL